MYVVIIHDEPPDCTEGCGGEGCVISVHGLFTKEQAEGFAQEQYGAEVKELTEFDGDKATLRPKEWRYHRGAMLGTRHAFYSGEKLSICQNVKREDTISNWWVSVAVCTKCEKG